MKLKYYVIFSFVFMFIMGLYVYSLESSTYTYDLPFSTTQLTLPVAVLDCRDCACVFYNDFDFLCFSISKEMLKEVIIVKMTITNYLRKSTNKHSINPLKTAYINAKPLGIYQKFCKDLS